MNVSKKKLCAKVSFNNKDDDNEEEEAEEQELENVIKWEKIQVLNIKRIIVNLEKPVKIKVYLFLICVKCWLGFVNEKWRHYY